MADVSRTEELSSRISDIGKACGFDHFIYVAKRADRRDAGFDVVLTGTPSNWWPHYERKGYAAIDPVLATCLARIQATPIAWRDEHFDTPERETLLADARDLGLMRWVSVSLGYGTPYRAKLSLVSGLAHEDRAWTVHMIMLIGFLGGHLHQAMTRIIADRIPALSSRERECLRWSATGLTAEEIGRALSTATSTVRFHLENAKRKLEASNLVQAVAKAIRLGLLEV